MPRIKKDDKKEEKTPSKIDFDKEKYEGAKRMIQAAMRNLERVSNYVEKMEQEERKEYYTGIPGVEGTFDGESLITEDGKKKVVPPNYAAKSRLVFGDKLKLFKDGDRDVYKQIERVERKKIEGILTKKEGKWYILSDSGSYKISDVSAEFNDAQLNDEAEAFIPADNLKSPFASLDRVKKSKEPKKSREEDKKDEKRTPIKKPVRKTVSKRAPTKKKDDKKPKDDKKEFVADILDEDDLR
ncbi:hypothetical protein ACFLZ4_01180 [Patescibacteria group bacterium]